MAFFVSLCSWNMRIDYQGRACFISRHSSGINSKNIQWWERGCATIIVPTLHLAELNQSNGLFATMAFLKGLFGFQMGLQFWIREVTKLAMECITLWVPRLKGNASRFGMAGGGEHTTADAVFFSSVLLLHDSVLVLANGYLICFRVYSSWLNAT